MHYFNRDEHLLFCNDEYIQFEYSKHVPYFIKYKDIKLCKRDFYQIKGMISALLMIQKRQKNQNILLKTFV